MIDKKFWGNENHKAMELLETMEIPDKEKLYRKRRINLKFHEMLSKNEISVLYFSLLHELYSYNFLKNYGFVNIALDCNHDEGPDFKLKDYYIECVCSSQGDIKANGLEQYDNIIDVFNYNKLLNILYPRITSSLNEKANIFKKYINDKIIKPNDPCIIFLSLGNTRRHFILAKYGFDFLDILISKGDMFLKIDPKSNKCIGSGYNHKEHFFKNSNPDIPIKTNFFIDNKHISAIIISTARFGENYDETNTFMFLNPYKNKVKIKDFYGICYWKMDKKHNYIPRIKGKSLWKELNKR